jgi:TRAP-type C4-dicarboxylate transport system permease small subunit
MYLYTSTLADSGNIGQVESFLQSVITTVAGLAGIIATGFFIVGGLRYITSSGNPQHLDKAKRTILYSALGLAITIGAFVLSNIVTSLASNAFGS